MLYIEVKQWVCWLKECVRYGQGVEKIRNRFAVLALENNISQFLVFGVSEVDVMSPVHQGGGNQFPNR